MRIIKASSQELERLQLIYDTGTDIEIFGKGWHIVHKWPGKSITLDGALTGMEYTNNMPMVATVTDIDTPTGTKLLGIGVSAYDDSSEQDESLANTNVFICEIDERSKQLGGTKSLLTDSGKIPIDLEDGRLPYTYIHKPTTEEPETK